ncbi:MAG: alpha/beta hydrolase [Cyanobacteria bacterium]|nr:alpha/beta hydrolase [Cyanobacteria bacterium CG_2015-16_32_12]NCO77906.1 alpha/beta hydrolase [Cyanobacteria bacterium CG_2015-22_32_23]NCQ03505.1 alpha/beta hydrolase [Cyanobacteria bacterium CG_2015-09_32_10]NCQ42004.1 alpha/beta hydrolase [Cyanobacteria bacterium CG_2015-04_32_10]NCS85573.1 alpha/beta hydrolase [Cyanobacteria bacterium CG_2015-02_32_10]
MLPENILKQGKNLTESTSIDIFQKIKFTSITTEESILTSYVLEGEKETPIILLHGFDSSLLEFRRLLPLLSKNHQVWALDLLGFGFTERKLSINYSPENIKNHFKEFWAKMIQKPVILIGASMGGATAIDLTLSYPEIIEKLILLDSGGLIKQPIISKFIIPPLDYFATEFLKNLKVRQSISKTAYFNPNFATEDALQCSALHLLCNNWNKALISFTKSGGYGSFSHQLKNIKKPTLIIWGENDKILGIKSANKFQEMIPHSKLIWVKNCGHVPHLEQSEITANHILDFTNN